MPPQRSDAPQQAPTPRTQTHRQPLPTDVVLVILSNLSSHDLARTGRFVCKAAAVQFSSHTLLPAGLHHPITSTHMQRLALCKLREALPHMSFHHKLSLLTAAAASGCGANLEAVWQVLQPYLFPSDALADRTNGHIHSPFNSSSSPYYAVAALARAPADSKGLTCDWLLRRFPAVFQNTEVLAAVAEHCDLGRLQRAWDTWVGCRSGTERLRPSRDLALAAARSGSADSRAKVEWALGGLLAAGVGGLAAAAAGARDVPLLQWLQQQGVRVSTGAALRAALRQGELETVRWLVLEGGARITDKEDPLGLCKAAAGSCREALRKLYYLVLSHGLRPYGRQDLVVAAAAEGQMETVRYLHEYWGVPLSAEAWVSAAGSGSVQTAAYLRGKGCPLSYGDAGEGKAYLRAAACGDLAMIRWLAGEGGCGRGGARLEEIILSWGISGMGQVSRSNSGCGAGAARDAPTPMCYGDTELLAAVQLLVAQGWPLDGGFAAAIGWVGELWVWSHGCVLTALAAAVCLGELPLVRWLHQQGCGQGLGRWDWMALIHMAATTGGETLLEWLWARCPQADLMSAMLAAARAGNRETFVWLARKWVKTGACDGGWRDWVRGAMRAGGVPPRVVNSCLGVIGAEVRARQVQGLGRLQRLGCGTIERCRAVLGIGGAGAAFVLGRLWRRLPAH